MIRGGGFALFAVPAMAVLGTMSLPTACAARRLPCPHGRRGVPACRATQAACLPRLWCCLSAQPALGHSSRSGSWIYQPRTCFCAHGSLPELYEALSHSFSSAAALEGECCMLDSPGTYHPSSHVIRSRTRGTAFQGSQASLEGWSLATLYHPLSSAADAWAAAAYSV